MPSSPGAELQIRAARPSDAAAVRAIYNDAVARTTATFDTRPRTLASQRAILREHRGRHPFLVAERGGRVAGWASLSRWSERRAYDATAEDSVYVAARERGRGVGRALLAALMTEARERGFHAILARITRGNPASRALHAKAGFRSVGVLREVGSKFGRRLDVEVLELLLEDRALRSPRRRRS